jgi:hypothetical protein
MARIIPLTDSRTLLGSAARVAATGRLAREAARCAICAFR